MRCDVYALRSMSALRCDALSKTQPLKVPPTPHDRIQDQKKKKKTMNRIQQTNNTIARAGRTGRNGNSVSPELARFEKAREKKERKKERKGKKKKKQSRHCVSQRYCSVTNSRAKARSKGKSRCVSSVISSSIVWSFSPTSGAFFRSNVRCRSSTVRILACAAN